MTMTTAAAIALFLVGILAVHMFRKYDKWATGIVVLILGTAILSGNTGILQYEAVGVLMILTGLITMVAAKLWR